MEARGVGIVLSVLSLAGIGYGLLDLLVPGLTIRWQIASTGKDRFGAGEVGRFFQRTFDIDPDREPWKDPVARRKVRLIGAFLVLLFGACFAAGLVLIQR